MTEPGSRPAILFVAPAMPALSGNGLAMRLGIFLEALARLGPTDLVVIPITGRGASLCGLADRLGVGARVISVDGHLDTQFVLIRSLTDPQERLAAFRRYRRPSLAAGASPLVLSELKRFTGSKRYKLVHIGRSYLSTAALAVGTGAMMTIDLDEDEVTSYRQLARQLVRENRAEEAAWMEAEADGYSHLLESIPSRFSRLFVSSATDKNRITSRNPAIRLSVVENAVAIPDAPAHRDDGCTLTFVGSFGYEPNVAGCRWFVSKVWPQIRAGVPVARLRLVGTNPPAAIEDLAHHEGIEVVGPVEDIADAYIDATVAIAPLHAGAGTRIKILEAAAFEVPVVATSLAVRGLRLTAPDFLWKADDPKSFAEAVLAALAQPEERKRRAARARSVVEAHYDRVRIIDDLAARFQEVLAGFRDEGKP
jgi:polysaccharide biosynthesis protein PslH